MARPGGAGPGAWRLQEKRNHEHRHRRGGDGHDDDAKKTQDELSKKSGKDFDKSYINDMVKDHEKDVAEFQKKSTAAQDPDLKAWVSKTLPTLQDHLKMAKETAAKVK